MEAGDQREDRIQILGVGNTLLRDDGFGIHVAERLRREYQLGENVVIRDGGTIGLALLPDVEDSDRLIVVDAGELKDAPGALRVFLNAEMDDHLSHARGTVHEVAMSDLLQAAALIGKKPQSRALVVVQPQSVDWGDAPTPGVAKAIPKACDAISEIIEGWRH